MNEFEISWEEADKNYFLTCLQKDFTKDDFDLTGESDVLFDSFNDAYEVLREYLNMSKDDFKKFKESENFICVWNEFCDAEKEFINILTKD